MKKLFFLTFIAFACVVLSSCMGETTWDEYGDWRKEQNAWLQKELAKTDDNGKPYYETVTANFDKNGVVYMHFYNDREKTKDNLVPLYTSTIDVKYHGSIYDGTPFDSTYLSTSPADSVLRCKFSTFVTGWVIAMLNMHVGDHAKVIMPYNVSYGEQKRSDVILPYTHLIFDIDLTDIYKYEAE